MADYTTRLETKYNRLSIEFKNLQAQLAAKDEALKAILEISKRPINFTARIAVRDMALAAIQSGKETATPVHAADVVCPECDGMRVRVYPGTPLGDVEVCRACAGKGVGK